MSDGGGQVSHAMRKVADELSEAEEPSLADEVRSLAEMAERMEDALSRVEYTCQVAESENVAARQNPEAPKPSLAPDQIAMIRKAVQG